MKTFVGAALISAIGSFSITAAASSPDLGCPKTVTTDLCEQLKTGDGSELLSFYLMFKRTAIDSSDNDPEKDTAAPPGGSSPDYTKSTRDLFGKYDLRWPEDTGKRATAPAQTEGVYRLFAAKSTILALSEESYVQELHRWAPDPPSRIQLRKPIGLSSQASSFDAKGRLVGLGERGFLPSFRFGKPPYAQEATVQTE